MTEFKPFQRSDGTMLVDIGLNSITDKDYFAVKGGVDELRKSDPAQYKELMEAAKSKKPQLLDKVYGAIHEKHPEIHAKIIGQHAGEIVGHIASGQPVRPMLNVNGNPFSPRVIEGEISASIRESSAGRGPQPTHLDDVRQNSIRLTGPGKVEGAFHVDAGKVVPIMGERHVQVMNDGSAKVHQQSMLSRHAAHNIATSEAQVLSTLIHDAKKVAGNNLVVRALLAGGAMVAAGAAAAAEAPEGQRLESAGKAALKAGAEHVVPGITETDKCVAQGKSWGNAGAALGGAGLTAGVAYLTGGVSLLGGAATTTLGAYTGDKIGAALGEGVCRMAQAAKQGISADNLAMTQHKPTEQTLASAKAPDGVGAKPAARGAGQGHG